MLTEEQLSELDKRISANAEKLIRSNERKLMKPRCDTTPGTKPLVIQNYIQAEMLEVLHGGEDNWPLWVDDVVQGIARLDWYRQGERSIPLSGKKIVQCFAYLETIDAYQVSHLLHIAERQARRYVKACQLAHDRLVNGFCDDSVSCLRYPEVFVYPREPNTQSDLGD